VTQTTHIGTNNDTIDQDETVSASTFNVGETDIGNDGFITANFCNVLAQGVSKSFAKSVSVSVSGKGVNAPDKTNFKLSKNFTGD